jgi:hypothetical protein
MAPRADTQQRWFPYLATANADPYLNRVITNGLPDPVGLAVHPLESTVASAHFPTPNQMRAAADFGLSTHWHAAPAGTRLTTEHRPRIPQPELHKRAALHGDTAQSLNYLRLDACGRPEIRCTTTSSSGRF